MSNEFEIKKVYVADNGDIFFMHTPGWETNMKPEEFTDEFTAKAIEMAKEKIETGEVLPCEARFSKVIHDHLSYYTPEGDFILTAGIHVGDKVWRMSDATYYVRQSSHTAVDAYTELVIKLAKEHRLDELNDKAYGG